MQKDEIAVWNEEEERLMILPLGLYEEILKDLKDDKKME